MNLDILNNKQNVGLNGQLHVSDNVKKISMVFFRGKLIYEVGERLGRRPPILPPNIVI